MFIAIVIFVLEHGHLDRQIHKLANAAECLPVPRLPPAFVIVVWHDGAIGRELD